jgi:hypothetical protein
MKINKEYITQTLCSNNSLTKVQLDLCIFFPSDLVITFVNYNGLNFSASNKCYEILNKKDIPVVSFEFFIPLSRFYEFYFQFKGYENDFDSQILNKYLPFACTVTNIWLMIGNTIDNLNKIFLWDMEYYEPNQELELIAEDYIDLINNRLIEVIQE